ncbi:MAG: putative aminopeptidase [Candidatus Azotimanducaceae bacterium]|jgi:predicted aminopeptidase
MPYRCLWVLVLTVVLLLSGCQTVEFYRQAVIGQSRLLIARQHTSDLVQSGSTDSALRERILFVNDVLGFASQLGLHHHGSYQSYVETGQRYVIWNVFAANPYDLVLKQSCFPVAGCVSYRGYFRQQHARLEAERLAGLGFEVYVGGVTAYSTLGWFDDPLLDTFLFQPDDQLAALIFHELAHQLVYVAGDTRFNESLATSIERYALGRWFTYQENTEALDDWQQARDRRDAVLALIESARRSLEVIYEAEITVDAMDVEKSRVIEDLRLRYESLASRWKEQGVLKLPFQRWMEADINNAKLETVADYNGWVPGLNLLADESGFEQFVLRLKTLAEMDEAERRRALTLLQP